MGHGQRLLVSDIAREPQRPALLQAHIVQQAAQTAIQNKLEY